MVAGTGTFCSKSSGLPACFMLQLPPVSAVLRFIFSPEGTFFRSFLLDEVVKSIDALSREQLVLLVSRLGLQVGAAF